jgi:hypothetical protein
MIAGEWVVLYYEPETKSDEGKTSKAVHGLVTPATLRHEAGHHAKPIR